MSKSLLNTERMTHKGGQMTPFTEIILKNEHGTYKVREKDASTIDSVIELMERAIMSAGYSLPEKAHLGYEYEE